jgi:uncharacterized protein Usg
MLKHLKERNTAMTNGIYSILSSKSHNPHYLNRYVAFIEACAQKNVGYEGITESHHILPKANDMFPEYECFETHPWNKIRLTPRQHFIAHWILWKALGGSQSYAFHCFITQVDCGNNHRQNLRVTSKVYEELKKQSSAFVSEQAIGKAAYIDKEGNRFRCRTDDPRVLSGELVSTTKGRKYKPRTEEQRLRTSKAALERNRLKKNQPSVSFYRGIEKIMVIKHSEDYYRYLNDSEWSTKCTPERKSLIASETNKNRKSVKWSEESRKSFSMRRRGKKTKKVHVIKTTLIMRNKRGWIPGNGVYDILVYDRQTDSFLKIDQLYFESDKHIKVSVRKSGKSKKAVNLETKETLVINPDLPRLPEGFVWLSDYQIVTVLNIVDRTFVEMMKYEIDEKIHIQIVAHNNNRAKIIDNEGKPRYVPKEIKELYFS